MQPLSAKARYLLAGIAESSANTSDARDNYSQALRLLDAMKKDPGAENLLLRSDFKAIYDASTAGSPSQQGLGTILSTLACKTGAGFQRASTERNSPTQKAHSMRLQHFHRTDAPDAR